MSQEPTQSKTPFMDWIAQEARVTKARLLPSDVLPPELVRQVAADLSEYLHSRGRSSKWFARQLGRAPTCISEFIGGTYKGDVEKLAREVNRKIDTLTAAEAAKIPTEFVRTEVARQMLGHFKVAYEQKQIAEIIGDAGVGKTMVARAAQAIYPGSVYVRINELTRHSRGLISALLAEMTSSPPYGNDRRWKELLDRLRDTDRLLIIDEAHRLAESGRSVLRDILDEAGVGLVLLGNDQLTEILDQEVASRRGQFASRVVSRCRISRDAAFGDGGGEPLFSPDDIKKVFEQHKLRLTGDGVSMLSEIANLPGSGALRLCRQIIGIVKSSAKLSAEPLNARLIRSILKQMHPVVYARVQNIRPEREETRRAATA
jgi:DNA transposition AAA+ family ATPase